MGFDSYSDPANAPGGIGEVRHPRERIILPTCKNHYVGRAIDDIKEFAKVNPKGAKADIFNLKSLQNGNGVVFIVEGFFDALSLIEIGQAAISLNSTSNAQRLSRI